MAGTVATIWESVSYELRSKAPQVNLSLLRQYPLPQSPISSENNIPTQLELFNRVQQAILPLSAGTALDPGIVQTALGRTKTYLGLDHRPILVKRSAPTVKSPSLSDLQWRQGFSPEVTLVSLKELRWKQVEAYVDDRLGPLGHLLDQLTEEDHIRFSNVSLERSLAHLPPPESIVQLHLPVSSWFANHSLIANRDGTRTLLLSDLPGKALLRHVQLLVKERLERHKPSIPKVSVFESEQGYQPHYGTLAAFFHEHQEQLQYMRSVVVGYRERFRDDWKAYYQSSIHSQKTPWSADLYRLANGKDVAVLASSVPFHGEILGENLAHLVKEFPTIDQVFVGGSGGSLHIREPYEFVFPSRVVSPTGVEVRNILSTEGEDLCHTSVMSPLMETPDILQRLSTQQVTTVDMEMGHVAEALAREGVQLGIGVLITDFPIILPISHTVSMAFQDSGQKYQHVSRFTHAVLTALLEKGRVPDHSLEFYLGRSLWDLSKENLARKMATVGKMTPQEEALFSKICQLTPTYSFQMTPERFQKIVDDGVILSTAQVAKLKKVPVWPYTPKVEDRLYGAFNYTFGSIGFHAGDKTYGEVEVKVRPEVWRARSWATYRSGWRSLINTQKEHSEEHFTYDDATPFLLSAARERLGRWVVVPKNYAKSLAIWVIHQLRKKDPDLIGTLLTASLEELSELLSRHKLVYLEGKIKGSLNLNDIEEVILSSSVSPDLIKKAESLGISVKVQSKQAHPVP